MLVFNIEEFLGEISDLVYESSSTETNPFNRCHARGYFSLIWKKNLHFYKNIRYIKFIMTLKIVIVNTVKWAEKVYPSLAITIININSIINNFTDNYYYRYCWCCSCCTTQPLFELFFQICFRSIVFLHYSANFIIASFFFSVRCLFLAFYTVFDICHF